LPGVDTTTSLETSSLVRSLTNPVVRPKLEIKTTEGSLIFDFGLT